MWYSHKMPPPAKPGEVVQILLNTTNIRTGLKRVWQGAYLKEVRLGEDPDLDNIVQPMKSEGEYHSITPDDSHDVCTGYCEQSNRDDMIFYTPLIDSEWCINAWTYLPSTDAYLRSANLVSGQEDKDAILYLMTTLQTLRHDKPEEFTAYGRLLQNGLSVFENLIGLFCQLKDLHDGGVVEIDGSNSPLGQCKVNVTTTWTGWRARQFGPGYLAGVIDEASAAKQKMVQK